MGLLTGLQGFGAQVQYFVPSGASRPRAQIIHEGCKTIQMISRLYTCLSGQDFPPRYRFCMYVCNPLYPKGLAKQYLIQLPYYLDYRNSLLRWLIDSTDFPVLAPARATGFPRLLWGKTTRQASPGGMEGNRGPLTFSTQCRIATWNCRGHSNITMNSCYLKTETL